MVPRRLAEHEVFMNKDEWVSPRALLLLGLLLAALAVVLAAIDVSAATLPHSAIPGL